MGERRSSHAAAVSMTLFAQRRHSLSQHSGVITPVRIMAIVAILLYRRVLVQEWTSFFRMTFIAEFIDGVGLNLFVAECAVDVVAA